MVDSGDLSPAKRTLLEQWRANPRTSVPTGITAAPSTSRARASVQQTELWEHHRREPETSSSNISYAATVDADVDADALARAVELLSYRHETLRTTLSGDDDDHDLVWQHIHDSPLATLTRVDLSTLGPAALARASELARQLAAEPFDLGAGPLVRTTLYRLGPSRHMIAVVVHHAVADGWSLAIAMKETGDLYDALVRGVPTDLSPLPVQYRDFAEWQWRWMDGPEAREHARYWEGRIRPHRATRLPSDFPPDSKRDLSAGLADIALPAGLSSAVRRVAQAEHASVFMVLLAAFAVLMRERTGDRVVSIGAPVACRNRPETHPLVGCFASVVPLVTTVSDDASFRQLLRSVRTESANAVTHEEYSLPMYLIQVEPVRDFAERPLYAAMFVLQPPMLPFEIAGARLNPVSLNRGQTRTPFAVHLWNSEPEIHGTVGYSMSLFRRSTVDAMIRRYLEIVEHATADPSELAGDL